MLQLNIKTSARVCFWGAPSQLPFGIRLMDQCLEKTGQNTGNLFIGRGLFEATQAPIKEYWDFYLGTPEEFDEKFDVLFIPASNFVFEYTNLSDQYEFFRKTKVRFFMFGLGSQMRDLSGVTLIPGTKKFLHLASERSTSIGVRGQFTAELLSNMGIQNTDVTGCPSMLSVPTKFSSIKNTDLQTMVIAGNFTNNARHHAFCDRSLMRIESALFSELVGRGGYYTLQNEQHEIAILRVLSYIEHLGEEDLWHLSRIKELFDYAMSEADLISFLRWKLKLFFSAGEWIRFMKTVDFSFGTRFHGNVAAILAGRPAQILCHDYRTLELCQFYRIPHRVINASSETPTISELCQSTDMSSFVANLPDLMETLSGFIRKNGFDVTVILAD